MKKSFPVSLLIALLATALSAAFVVTGCAASKSAVSEAGDTVFADTKHGKIAIDGFDTSAYASADSALGGSGIAKLPSSPTLADTSLNVGLSKEDSLAEALYREEEGQDFSSLFENMDTDSLMEVDTLFAWCNSKINSGRFDYKALSPKDSIRIPLVDSAHGKFYVHPSEGRVTSPFGLRRYLWHHGIDTKLNKGDSVRSALDGIVRVIQYDRRGYGNVVVVRHHNGLETVYGHLSKIEVKANQSVKAGATVGLGGNTGRSTGAHLHFEIRYFGEPFDPRYIIDFDNYTLKSDTLVLTRANFDYLTEARKTVVYTVRRGDNLGSIARRHGTTVNNLCRLNGIKPTTILSIGRRLIIRNGSEAEKQVVKPAAKGAAAAPDTSTNTPDKNATSVASVPPDTSAAKDVVAD